MNENEDSDSIDEPENSVDQVIDPELNEIDQLMSQDDLEEVSLDDLGAAYARAAAEHDPEVFANPDTPAAQDDPGDEPDAASPLSENSSSDEQAVTDEDELVTPEAIVEGALFIGHPENKSLSPERIASLMRDMTPEDVQQIVSNLNESYKEHKQALRIAQDDAGGYTMTVAPEVEKVRRSFLGKVREARLTQSAIEVLSLVAYQPGITAQKVQDQRGRESNSLLNQLVRRRLLQMERVKPESGGRAVPHYHPTERFLYLFGIESLDDLPQVEEGIRED